MRGRAGRSSHPRTRRSIRWWIGNSAPWQLVGVFVGLILGLSLLLTLATAATASGTATPNDYEYTTGRDRLLRLFLAVIRAVLGVDAFPREPSNPYHEAFATTAAFIGATLPALLVGVLAIRLFAMRLLIWRSKLNVLTAVELRSDTSSSIGSGADGVLAIRFYKRLRGVTLSDLRVRAYLGYRTTSLVDGTTFFKRDLLKVLSADADEVDERVWPRIETAMPLTLWIPLHAPAPDGKIASIQGHQLQDKNYLIFVTAQAKVMGINIDLTDHKRYYLRRRLQVGRPVAIEPIVDSTQKEARRGERSWQGWDRFEEASDYGVFLYGSMASPAEIGAILGRPVVEGVDYLPARLGGWRRTWNVCTDNTTTTKVRYYRPGTDERPPVQVLFLTVEPDDDSSVAGYLLRVEADHLMALDTREGNYDRILVTGSISVEGGPVPAVVWTYVGKETQVAKARAAIMRGTARIRREYLDDVVTAFDGKDEMLAELQATLSPPPAPVEPLDRQVG